MKLRRWFRVAAIFLLLNAAWEVVQLPLYTLWHGGTWGEITFAIIHCTAGDLLIGLAVAAISIGVIWLAGGFPDARSRMFLFMFLGLGMSYTVFSEWLNVHVRESWAYTDQMPVVPILGTGLSPLLQWLVVPVLTWLLARRP